VTGLQKDYCLIALAGFGREFFAIQARLKAEFRQRCEVVGRNMELLNGVPVYKQNHLANLLHDICEHAFPLSLNPEGFCPASGRRCRAVPVSGTSSAVVCESGDGRLACRDKRPGSIIVIWREGIGDDIFAKALNSCTYLYKLAKGSSVEEVIDVIAAHLDFSGTILWKEIHHGPKKTPILLPVRNFEPDDTATFVGSLHHHPPDAQRLIDDFRATWFDSSYRSPKGGRPGAFLDSRQIGFSKDRKIHDRRVSRQSDEVKTKLRLLGAFYRFGIPYEIGFHYDVCRPRRSKPRPLNASFWNGAREAKEHRTEVYLNIAPDDEIR
jgi:hypothetical protein